MSILSLSSLLVAKGALLVTTLQAIGHTRQYLAVTFASTLSFLVVVGLGALPIGTLAGAVGRAILYTLIVAMARLSLRHTLPAHTNPSMKKAIPLAAGVSLPLLAIDQLLTIYHPAWPRPSFHLGILFLMFIHLPAVFRRQQRVLHHV